MAAPCKRWGHGVVLYENHMYLFGGSGSNTNPRSWEAIYIMNCETFEWERVCPSDPFKGNLPESRDSHSSTKIGNNMYIFGGSNGNPPFNDMFAFNFTFRSWNKVNSTGDVPLAREGHSAAALNDRYIFIYGGWNGKTIFNNYYLFDSLANVWRKVEPEDSATEPPPRESHTCCVVKDSFYIFGGQGHNFKKKENYFNDFYKAKLNLHKNMEKVTCKWEKVIAKNNVNPPHRTSHSATVYKDRYIFIIGGEGYSMDNKDPRQFGDEKKDVSEKDFEDDKAPCFPKNDVWIFDTDFGFWSQLEAKNSELLLPRFTHSCCVFKDQFIIFGGLKDYKNAVDDLIVLTIDDEDYKAEKNKKDIDLCNQCRRLFMVEGESKSAQRKTMVLSNEDLMLEGANNETLDESHNISNQFQKLLTAAQKKPKQADISAQFFQEQIPFITLANLSKIAQNIPFPFAAMGLLVDNAKLKKASSLKICSGYTKTQNKRFLSFTDDGEVWTVKEIYEVFLNMKLDISHYVDYEQKDPEEREKSHHELIKSRYAANLKMGGFRLGETIVYGSKTETSIIIGFISVANSTEKEENDVFLFASWGLKTEARGNEEKRKKIVEILAEYFSEQEFSELIGKNTLLVLDLKNVELSDKKFEELHFPKKSNDVIFCPQKLQNQKLAFPYRKYLDFSLKKYLEHFFLTPQATKIYLNGEEILTNLYAENLQKSKEYSEILLENEIKDCLNSGKIWVEGQEIEPPENKTKDPTTTTILAAIPLEPIMIIEPEIEKKEENDGKEPKNEEKMEIIQEDQKTNIEEKKQEKTESLAVEETTKISEQGVLLYSEGRLIGRAENMLFGNFADFNRKWKHKGIIFDAFGALELKEFLKMNLFKTVIKLYSLGIF